MQANSNEIKISEILHLAADKYLSSASDRLSYVYELGNQYQSWYSCNAVAEATYHYVKGDAYNHDEVYRLIENGLEVMGCDCGSLSLFDDSSDPQGDRYMWLKFAAIIAEEQEAAGYKLEI